MGWPTPSFGSLAGTQPLSLFDTMFAQVAAMVSIPCTAGGSANTAVDGFRLLFGAGNISSGSVRVYGIA